MSRELNEGQICMIISINTEKVNDKIQYPFIVKKNNKLTLSMEGP